MSTESFSSIQRSINESKESFRRSRSSIASSSKNYKKSFVLETNYWPVTKWLVDYNNKNYVRSLTNKSKGLHRQVPNDEDRNFKVEYNNKDYVRSFVNNHQGLHRKREEVPRKLVPDDDDLLDSTGWEFEYGPEFNQVEQDVPFIIPEGKRIARGQFRYHGTIRNSNDYDGIEEEERSDEIDGYNREEFKYGTAFFQEDSPFHVEEVTKDRRVSRGGFRYIDVERSVLDSTSIADFSNPAERQRRLQSIDLRYKDTLRSALDLSREGPPTLDSLRTGKPFKQTILKKTYDFETPTSTESVLEFDQQTYRTEVTLTPGRGDSIVHSGTATVIPSFRVKQHPNIRRIFEPKSGSRMSLARAPRPSASYDAESKFSRAHEAWKTVKVREKYVSPRRNSKASIVKDEGRFRSAQRAWKRLMSGRSPDLERLESGRKQKKKSSGRSDYTTTHQSNRVEYEPEASSESDKWMKFYKHDSKKSRKELKSSKIESNVKQWRTGDYDEERVRTQARQDRMPTKYETKVDHYDSADYEEPDVRIHEIVVEHRPGHGESKTRHKHYKTSRDMPDIRQHKMTKECRPASSESRKRQYYSKTTREMPHTLSQYDDIGEDIGHIDKLDEEDVLMVHRKHPQDRGQSVTNIFEKYTGEDGSEIWVKTKEKYVELHHVKDK